MRSNISCTSRARSSSAGSLSLNRSSVVPLPAPLMAPPLDELVPDAHHVENLADHEVDQVVHRLRVVVKARRRRDHDPTSLGDRRHVLYVDQAVGHLALQYHEPPALL